MKYFLVALMLLPSVAAAHDRIVHGIVVPNGYDPAWEDGRVNRDPGNLGSQAYVEAGHFRSAAAASAAGNAISGAGVQVVQIGTTGEYRLWIGPYSNRDTAQAGLNAAHAAGLGHGRIR